MRLEQQHMHTLTQAACYNKSEVPLGTCFTSFMSQNLVKRNCITPAPTKKNVKKKIKSLLMFKGSLLDFGPSWHFIAF